MFSFYHVLSFLFFVNLCSFSITDSNSTKFLLLNGSDTLFPEIGISFWSYIQSTKKPLTKFKIRKRASRKNLGDKCSTFSECPPAAFCMSGICSCPYEFYTYIPPSQAGHAVCRKKVKFGFNCNLTDDCIGYDANSACYDGVCKCINGTHYIGSRNLLSYHKRCYKILEREGDICEIDEQCSRLADNHHKCRCIGRCDCASINRYGGCSICHENIKRTFFGGAAFIVILLSSRVFSKMRSRTNTRQQQNIPASGSRFYRLNTSRTVPLRSVSYTRSNLRANRHVTTSLPDVFLIESHHSLIGIHSSNTTDFYPQTSPTTTERSAERSEDAPPSYEDIIGDDCVVWNEPPPAYHEVTAKNS